SHEEGCEIIGGFVYRGFELDYLVGAYIYGDLCSGKIWALHYDGTEITEHVQLVDTDLIISSFGVDERGELYIVSYTEGIYRLRSSN
ncbi:MAG: glucose sorbosone dehydrogenase, partial [Thaumarchaeota archaeon]|nr:glucose sorbosone dehydrogenase [Nitrososphaerota archaeon]